MDGDVSYLMPFKFLNCTFQGQRQGSPHPLGRWGSSSDWRSQEGLICFTILRIHNYILSLQINFLSRTGPPLGTIWSLQWLKILGRSDLFQNMINYKYNVDHTIIILSKGKAFLTLKNCHRQNITSHHYFHYSTLAFITDVFIITKIFFKDVFTITIYFLKALIENF